MKKTNKRSSKSKQSKNLFSRVVPNKWVALIFIAIIAGLGSYFVFFSEAAPNNCQNQDGVPICDVDLVVGPTDSVLSVDSEALNLGNSGWGMYFGPAFRAPTKSYNGAVPIYRVYSTRGTLHDFLPSGQKAAKEAKYQPGIVMEGVPFYAWETQVPGTVPIYRLSRGGEGANIMLTSDKAWLDRILAIEANDPNGWRQNQYGDFVAFYAYPPGYTVPGTVNPGDCGNPANLANPECKTQRESLEGAIGTDALPTSNECPATIEKYLKAAFPSQFSQACQDKWNNFAKDCSKQENFLSDRCKTQRAQLEAGLAERAAIEAAAKRQGSLTQLRSLTRSAGAKLPAAPKVPNNCPKTVEAFAAANKQSLNADCINIWTKFLNDLKRIREIQQKGRVNASNSLYTKYYSNLTIKEYYQGVNRNEAYLASRRGQCVIRYSYHPNGKIFSSRKGVEIKPNTTKEQCEMEYRFLIQKKKEQDDNTWRIDMNHHAFEKDWVPDRS